MGIIGVDETIEKLNSLVDGNAIDNALDELATYGVEKAKDNLESFSFYNAPSGISESIKSETTAHFERTISADGGYAAFIEYGTGVRGKNSPHPAPPSDWIYDTNEHGEKGWWYPTDKQPPDGQPKRYDELTGQWYAWTKGMGSRPFMYNTAKDIEKVVAQKIEKALQEGK